MYVPQNTPLPRSEGFQPTPQTLVSFAGQPRFVNLHGPFKLYRLLDPSRFKRDDPGLYWFSGALIRALRNSAAADISKKNHPSERLNALRSLHMSFELRDKLAVTKDWNETLGHYVSISLDASQSLVALIGPVKQQPYYDPEISPAKSRQASHGGIKLPGHATQIVIDFRFAANAPFTKLIRGPYPSLNLAANA